MRRILKQIVFRYADLVADQIIDPFVTLSFGKGRDRLFGFTDRADKTDFKKIKK